MDLGSFMSPRASLSLDFPYMLALVLAAAFNQDRLSFRHQSEKNCIRFVSIYAVSKELSAVGILDIKPVKMDLM